MYGSLENTYKVYNGNYYSINFFSEFYTQTQIKIVRIDFLQIKYFNALWKINKVTNVIFKKIIITQNERGKGKKLNRGVK